MSLLGIDVGTSATKGVLVDDRGRVVAQARRGYRLTEPAPGGVELDATRVWGATRDVIGSLATIALDAGTRVRAVCVGGSGDEVVAVDAKGRPVGPVVMAADRRSGAQGRAFAASEGADGVYRRTGLWDLAIAPLARYAWMREHEPDRAARVARLLSWPEWVAARLGLPQSVDATLAARTLAYDVLVGRYSTRPPGDRLPEGLLSGIVPTGTVIGTIPARDAERVGLTPDVPFVMGGFDQAMATLGAGAIEPGVAHDGNGSWEALSIRVTRADRDLPPSPGGWSVGPSATDATQLEMMASWVGGSALRWVVGLASGGRAGDAAMRRALGRLPPGDPRAIADVELGATVAPPLGGQGAVAALDLGVGHADLVLAILDGLAHRLREATAQLDRLGVRVTRIRASGGGARSDRWLQLKADATGLPVERVSVEEVGAYAAAVMAGSAVGVLPPPEPAIRELVTVVRRFEPDPAAVARHAERAERHRALADGLATLAS